MEPTPYTTLDYRAELQRVRRARRRNTIAVVVVDAVVIVTVAVIAFSGLVF